MGQPAKQEIHDYLDDLCQQEVFGSVTIRFQKGDIVSVSDALEWKPGEIVDAYKKGDGLKKKVLIVRRRPESGDTAAAGA